MDNEIIIGMGEVGSALSEFYGCPGWDIRHGEKAYKRLHKPWKEVVHVCVPYSGSFINEVNWWALSFQPNTIIIHSTVPVGTCRKIHESLTEMLRFRSDYRCPQVVHSPIRGQHNRFQTHLKWFTKMYGGPESELVAGRYVKFHDVECTDKWENTEAAKLWCSTAYKASIDLEKEIWQYCEDFGLDYDFVYRKATKSYNTGYILDVMSEDDDRDFARPILDHVDGPIGGHCVIPNVDLLSAGIHDLDRYPLLKSLHNNHS